jgi:hypothetical protein
MLSKFVQAFAASLFCALVFISPRALAGVYQFSDAPATTDTPLSLGFTFTTNSALTVTSLGYYDYQRDGFITPHVVGIFAGDGKLGVGALLASVLLNAGVGNALSGDFRYQDITPTILNAGQTFTIAATTGGPEDPWAFGNGYGAGQPPFNTILASFSVNPAISIAEDSARFVYQNDNILRDPGEHFSNYTLYAGPNFNVSNLAPPEFASSVPELSTWWMMLMGFAGIAGLAYRRAKTVVV